MLVEHIQMVRDSDLLHQSPRLSKLAMVSKENNGAIDGEIEPMESSNAMD